MVTGGDINTEYSITAYDSSIDGTDDMVDGNESWYSIANNFSPIAVADTATVLEDANTTAINVIANDTDPESDTLILTSVTTAGAGTVAINEDGVSINYTPIANFNRIEIITYTITDGHSSSTGTLTITVTAVNDAPIAVEDNATVLEDAELTSINVITNDTDVDGNTSSTTTTENALELIGIIDFTVPSFFSGGSDGKAIHLLVGNNHIPDLSIYGFGVANNGGGTDGQEYTFPSQLVQAGSHILVARSPEAMDIYLNASSEFDYVFLANTSMSMNGDDAIELFYNEEVIETFGDINVDGTGKSWEYRDSWAYKVSGEWTYGELNCTDGSITSCESTCPYPFTICSGSSGSSVGLTLTAVTTAGTGTVAVNADGVSVDYTPALDFNGTEIITYTVSDGSLTDTTGTLTITVTAVNDAPVAVEDAATVLEDAELTSIDVITNDTDVEADSSNTYSSNYCWYRNSCSK